MSSSATSTSTSLKVESDSSAAIRRGRSLGRRARMIGAMSPPGELADPPDDLRVIEADAARRARQARVGGEVAVRVDVDDPGRAARVEPHVDPAVVAQPEGVEAAQGDVADRPLD